MFKRVTSKLTVEIDFILLPYGFRNAIIKNYKRNLDNLNQNIK